MADKVTDSLANSSIVCWRGYHTAAFILALYQALGRQLPSATPRAVINTHAWYTSWYENSRV